MASRTFEPFLESRTPRLLPCRSPVSRFSDKSPNRIRLDICFSSCLNSGIAALYKQISWYKRSGSHYYGAFSSSEGSAYHPTSHSLPSIRRRSARRTGYKPGSQSASPQTPTNALEWPGRAEPQSWEAGFDFCRWLPNQSRQTSREWSSRSCEYTPAPRRILGKMRANYVFAGASTTGIGKRYKPSA